MFVIWVHARDVLTIKLRIQRLSCPFQIRYVTIQTCFHEINIHPPEYPFIKWRPPPWLEIIKDEKWMQKLKGNRGIQAQASSMLRARISSAHWSTGEGTFITKASLYQPSYELSPLQETFSLSLNHKYLFSFTTLVKKLIKLNYMYSSEIR